MAKKQQIKESGVPLKSGLEVFSSITLYNKEYLNWGDSRHYAGQLGADTNYATTAANPHTDALINSPASIPNQWYRYHTNGSPYTVVTPPASISGLFLFYGLKTGSTIGYGGIYQKLSGLIIGNEYEISITPSLETTTQGTFYVTTYSENGGAYSQNSISTITVPLSSSDTNVVKSTFTAKTTSDIFLIYFESEESVQAAASINSISIKEREDYLIPITMQDGYNNAHKVLRRDLGNKPVDNE